MNITGHSCKIHQLPEQNCLCLVFKKGINELEDQVSSSSNSCVLEQDPDGTALLAVKEWETLLAKTGAKTGGKGR